MEEFNKLYNYAKIILGGMKLYKKGKKEEDLEIVDEYLRKESKYLSTFSLMALNQLYAMVLNKANSSSYDLNMDLNNDEDVLIYEHMKNALISSLFFASLLENNNFSMTKEEAHQIFCNPVVDKAFSDASFLDKYMQACESSFLKKLGKTSYSECFIYLPYYVSVNQVLKKEDVSLDWDGKEALFINLYEVLGQSINALGDKKNHNINRKRFKNYCNHLSKNHGYDLECLLESQYSHNKEALEILDEIDFEYLIDEEIVHDEKYLDYSFDYSQANTYNKLAYDLLYNNMNIYELLKSIMSSNRNTYVNYSLKLKQALDKEESLFKKLTPEEIPTFIQFLEYCYLPSYSDIDTYFDFIHDGKISYSLLQKMGVKRIIDKLTLYMEYAFDFDTFTNEDEDAYYPPLEEGDSSFLMQIYLYLIGSIDKKELERRYNAYCNSDFNGIDNLSTIKVNRMVFLNVITELLHTKDLDFNSQLTCDELAMLLIFANGLEDALLLNKNGFNYHFSYENPNIDVSYEDLDIESDYLLQFIEEIHSHDTDSELSALFRDYCESSAISLIDPKRLEYFEKAKSSMDNLSISPESQALRDLLSLKITPEAYDSIVRKLKKNKKEN